MKDPFLTKNQNNKTVSSKKYVIKTEKSESVKLSERMF